MFSKINPPIIYQSFIVLMVVIYFLLPTTRIILFPYNLVGVVLFLVGAYVATSTRKSFKKTNTPLPPASKPTMLHTSGPFRYTRNPMYLAIAIGLLGLAILMSSFINFVFPVIFLLIMDVVYVRLEEKILEDELGNDYLDYKKRVRRWI